MDSLNISKKRYQVCWYSYDIGLRSAVGQVYFLSQKVPPISEHVSSFEADLFPTLYDLL